VLNLHDVMIITFLMLSIFTLFGLELYKGILRSKCVYNPPSNLTHAQYSEFINDDGMEF
jgi:hypothetical protein